jgi:hypothetical protein
MHADHIIFAMIEKKQGLRKGEVAYIFAIVFGLIIGVLIKRIKIGLMIGLVLCVLIALSGWVRFTRK